MPVPSFMDPGGWNLRDIDSNKLVAKVHVEPSAADIAGGRSYLIHWAVVKSDLGESGWGTWIKPTQQAGRSWKWEPSNESLSTFLAWMHDGSRKSKLRYHVQKIREQDFIP